MFNIVDVLSIDEWSPLLLDIFVILAILSCLVYVAAISYGVKYNWSNHRHHGLISRTMCFYCGLALTIFVFMAKDHGHLGKHSTDLFCRTSSRNLGSEGLQLDIDPRTGNVTKRRSQVRRSLLDNPEKVIFITTTRFGLVQHAVLTKIGQAVFPVRDNVIWIVVSTTTAADFDKGTSGFVEKNDTISADEQMTLHLEAVENRLKRFGVSYVLLESHPYLNQRFTGLRGAFIEDSVTRGIQTGVIWALQTFDTGVLFIGHEEYTYNYQIFNEIRKTKIASMWPVGLGRSLGYSSPILEKGSRQVKGYHTGEEAQWDSVLMEFGSFALNIAYLLENVDHKSIWKITWDGGYSLHNLGIRLEDIEPLADDCTRILVWRTRTLQHPWPVELKFKKSYRQSNIMTLIKDVYGVRYPYIKKYFNHTDKVYKHYL